MNKKVDYSIPYLKEIMEEYADISIDFTNHTERNSGGEEELIVYVKLGQSLDILGVDEVYYNTLNRKYFIFFSTFLSHLDLATGEEHAPFYSFLFNMKKLDTLIVELM